MKRLAEKRGEKTTYKNCASFACDYILYLFKGIFTPMQLFAIKSNKYFNLNKLLLMGSNREKHSHVVNATISLRRGVLIFFPLHCEEISPSNKISTFGHIPRATAVT